MRLINQIDLEFTCMSAKAWLLWKKTIYIFCMYCIGASHVVGSVWVHFILPGYKSSNSILSVIFYTHVLYNKGAISRLYVPNTTQSLCGSRQKAKAPSAHKNLDWELRKVQKTPVDDTWIDPGMQRHSRLYKAPYLNKKEFFPVMINFSKH